MRARPSERATRASPHARPGHGHSVSIPSAGDLRVWWVPQVPMKAFEVDVPDLETAVLILGTLSQYDAFQFENNIKPDYCNMGGLVEFDADVADWFDWECLETGEPIDVVRRDPEMLAIAIEARRAETSGSACESAGLEGIAETTPPPPDKT